MRGAILTILLVCGVYAINLESFTDIPLMEQVQVNKIHDKLFRSSQESTWGQVILSMVEITTEAHGALDQLTQAVDELVEDISAHLQVLDDEFSLRSDAFNHDNIRLEQQINDAQIEISEASDLINNMLIPVVQQASQRQTYVGKLIVENRKRLAGEILTRERQSQQFSARLSSHQQALDAIDECLELLSGVSSFIQMKRFQGNVQLIEARIEKKETLYPLVINIMELTSDTNLQDPSSVRQLNVLFNELRNSVVEEINRETSEENQNQALFEQTVSQINTEYLLFQGQISELIYQIAQLNTQLEETNNFMNTRKSDLQTSSAQSKENQDTYANESQIFRDTRTEYQNEQMAAQQAKDLITNPDFVNQVLSKVGL